MKPKYKLSYEIEYSSLKDFMNLIPERLQQVVGEAVETAGNYFVMEWIRTAESKFRHSQGGYARGIQDGTMYPYQGNPLEFRIIHTEKYAMYLENGADLKNMLSTSQKVRVNKKNEKYLVIPFSHGNPKSVTKQPMPKAVYSTVKNMTPSYITGRYKEGVQQGADSYEEAQFMRINNKVKTTRNAYKWGQRLTEKMLIEAGITDEAEKAKYIGMYRFEKNPTVVRQIFATQPTKQRGIKPQTIRAQNTASRILTKFVNPTTGSRSHSNYITFRVMKEGQTGWEIKPMGILHETVQRTEGRVKEIIAEGVRLAMKDL